MSFDYEERAEDLEAETHARLHARPSYRAIERSVEEVGFAPPHKPYLCRSRAGRWRTAHDLDRDGVCIYCDRKLSRA